MLVIFTVLLRRGSDVVMRVDVSELLPCIRNEFAILEEEGVLRIVVIRKTLFLSLESAFHNPMFRHYFLREALLLLL